MSLLFDPFYSPEGGRTVCDSRPFAAIQRISPLEHPAWDHEISRLPQATFFHGSVWARLLIETYGFNPVYFVIREGDRITGLLPCMELNGRLYGRRGVGLPFSDHAGPLAEHGWQASALFQAMDNHARASGWRTWECRGGHQWRPEAPASLSFYHHTLDLSVGEDELVAGLDPAVRRALRKAARHDLEAWPEDSYEGMMAYYELHCRTRQRQGLPPQPRAFFQKIYQQIIAPGHGHVFLVRAGDRAIAGAVFFHWGQEAIYKFGASEDAYQGLRPSNLLLWFGIAYYATWGFTRLDLGRTSLSNEGLRRFKLGWGTDETRVDYLKYDFGKDTFLTERDRVHGWYNALFRAMPLPALKGIGTLLYRHLA